MKTRIAISNTFFFIFIALVIASCKKDKDGFYIERDYRNKWIGTYHGQGICIFSVIDPSIPPDTTFNDTVSVTVIKPSAPEKINVNGYICTIDSTGNFSYMDELPGMYVMGHFVSDSIYLSSFSGGLGGGTNCTSKGKKQ